MSNELSNLRVASINQYLLQKAKKAKKKLDETIELLDSEGVLAASIGCSFLMVFVGINIGPNAFFICLVLALLLWSFSILYAQLEVLLPLHEKQRQQEHERERKIEKKKFFSRQWSIKEAAWILQEMELELELRSVYGLGREDVEYYALDGINKVYVGSGYKYRRFSTQELQERAQFLKQTVDRQSKPQEVASQASIQLGTRQVQTGTVPVLLPESVRHKDVYLIGGKQTGKSTLLFTMARQDIIQNLGATVIDAHGDLVEDLILHVPPTQVENTIYFDATNESLCIPLDVFSAQDRAEIALLTDDILVLFKRLSEGWGERMESILRYTLYTLLSVKGTSFLDIARIIQDKKYREDILSQITDSVLLDFWEHQFARLPKNAIQPILSRMSDFLLSPVLSKVLSYSENALKIYDVMQSKTTLLINIAKGKVGKDTSHVVGSLAVSQFQIAAMRRAKLPKGERELYPLYVDEFQNFASSAFDEIISEAGKYRLSLTIAHQYISQLDDRLRDAVLGNVGTFIMLPVAEADARQLKAVLSPYKPEDLVHLKASQFEAIGRMPGGEAFVFQTLAPPPAPAKSYRAEIIEHTRTRYTTSQLKGSSLQVAKETAPGEQTIEPSCAVRARKEQVAAATAQEFATNKDKILHYVGLAEYLSTRQIISLCYSHLAKSAQATTASRDLRALVKAKRLKSEHLGKQKIYYTGRTCEPTAHNLGVRDVFTRIATSGYEIAEVDFAPNLQEFIPDLLVSFLCKDGSLVRSLWEFDTGTEIVGKIIEKVEQYRPYCAEYFITFVVTSAKRLSKLKSAIKEPFVTFAVLDEFETINDAAFYSPQDEQPTSFFL